MQVKAGANLRPDACRLFGRLFRSHRKGDTLSQQYDCSAWDELGCVTPDDGRFCIAVEQDCAILPAKRS